ncbi:Pimeloyl-ACP methyl ester carboxylesterase [Chryseolinea serpens]|uniref:Pimeloyl-ACP methyl ester carboxylesterase n=1 Tax=Chryseolinea serpens TaxID=947013 RepID=A0A1M5XTT8_9BACT|nr:alpha/beta hydrolase [Chryseolinea serpens]SHI03132.1 Pimeloyl-ACP methyl ester carboxylesterase [Chryseolinea serpens]
MKYGNPPLYNQSFTNTGAGPVVILLHGLFGSNVMWKAVVNALKEDFKVIVPRLPLFELPVEQANIKHLAALLHEFIEWNQFTNVTLVGHALGGQVALLYAHLHPGNVHKLVLTASAGSKENSPVLNARNSTSSYRDVHNKILEACYRSELISNELVDEIYTSVHNIPRRISLWNLALSSRRANVSSFLTTIRHPVLLIWGLQDKITPPEAALHFHDLLPNGRVKFIDKCGHMPMVEQAKEFNDHLLLFLRSHPAHAVL